MLFMKKLSKAIVAVSVMIGLTGLTQVAQADTILGVYADANYWDTENENTYNTTKATMDDKGRFMASVGLEHGVPLVPNVKVRYADLANDGTYGTSATASKLSLDSTDLIAYYEILDNVVSIDVGLGAKALSGDWQVGTNSKVDLGETLPMAYLSAGAKLPFTGFSAKAEIGVAGNGDVEATDALAEIQYDFVKNMAVDIGAKVGYRVIDMKYDETGKKFDSEFKGPYVGLQFHF